MQLLKLWYITVFNQQSFILGKIFLFVGCCLIYCRVFSNIPGEEPSVSNTSSLNCDNTNVLDINATEAMGFLHAENHWLILFPTILQKPFFYIHSPLIINQKICSGNIFPSSKSLLPNLAKTKRLQDVETVIQFSKKK